MKKLSLLVMLVLVATLQSFAQDVPSKVKEAFNQKFSNAKSIHWDKESATEWEAEFKMNGKEYSANFATDGTWKETEYEIEFSDVPEVVKITLSAKYSNYKKEEIEFSEKPEGNFYEFELESDEKTIEVAFNESGEIVKEKILESEDEN